MAKLPIAILIFALVLCPSQAKSFHEADEVGEDTPLRRDVDLQTRERGIFEDEEKEDQRHPMEAAMLERRMQFDFAENDMDAFVDTTRLLDAVLRDGGSVQGGTAVYRFGSGAKQECIDGKKSIPAICQWTGQVQWSGKDEVKETKLSVAKKYCKQAGLTKPKNKIVDC